MPRAGLTRAAVVDLAQAVADDAGPGGFDALTLASVAARAGVAVPSLYKHVDGLPDLRREVALRAVEDFTAAVGSAVASAEAGHPSRALRTAARMIRAYALAHPARYAAVQAAPSLGDLPDGRLSGASARAVAVLADALRAAVPRRPGGADHPPNDAAEAADAEVHVVRLVRAAVHGFVDLELRGGFALPQDRDASFERLLDVLARGLHLA